MDYKNEEYYKVTTPTSFGRANASEDEWLNSDDENEIDNGGVIMTGASYNYGLKGSYGGTIGIGSFFNLMRPKGISNGETSEKQANKSIQFLSTAKTYAEGRATCKTQIGFRSFGGKVWRI